MWSVPADLRPFALAISEAMQHLLGDIPTPPALGATQDSLQNWRLSMSLFGLLGLGSALSFLGGAALAAAGRSRDYRCVAADAGADADGSGQGQGQRRALEAGLCQGGEGVWAEAAAAGGIAAELAEGKTATAEKELSLAAL